MDIQPCWPGPDRRHSLGLVAEERANEGLSHAGGVALVAAILTTSFV